MNHFFLPYTWHFSFQHKYLTSQIFQASISLVNYLHISIWYLKLLALQITFAQVFVIGYYFYVSIWHCKLLAYKYMMLQIIGIRLQIISAQVFDIPTYFHARIWHCTLFAYNYSTLHIISRRNIVDIANYFHKYLLLPSKAANFSLCGR